MQETRFQLVALLAVLVLGPGCSGGALSTTSLELKNWQIPFEHSIDIDEIQSKPFVYRLDQTDTPAHFTALRECGFRDRASLNATTRSLFVGVRELRILKQEKREFSQQLILVSTALGRIEQHPVVLITYSGQQEDCVIDVIFWERTEISDDENAVLSGLQDRCKDYDRIASTIFSDIS